MILTKNTKVSITKNNIDHYSKLFNNIEIGNKIDVSVDNLPKGSHKKITCKCDICGVIKEIPYRDYIKNINNGGYYSCVKCKKDKLKNSLLQKYGYSNYYNEDKSKKTCLEKYGVENVFQNEEIKNKIKQSNLKKYGVEYTSQSDIIKNKIKQTNLKKYGTEHHLQNKNILEKQKMTNFEKYGVEYVSQNEEIRNKIINGMKKYHHENSKKYYDNFISSSGDTVELYCPICNNSYTTYKYIYHMRKNLKINPCLICKPLNSLDSSYQKELNMIIKENYCGEIKYNADKIIKNGELDIYIPGLNISFEFNGLYWHSELFRDKNYHLNKTECCEKIGIKLIHIYEDDWIYKQDIVKSRVLNLLGKSNKIMARKCEIKEIESNKLIREFLEKNHIQGFIGSKIKIGLFYNNELISLMTFGNLRKSMGQKSSTDLYEMLRFCNKLNTSVIGGASKLFKYFIDKYDPKEVISYADRSWSQGELYEKLGFKLIHKTKPNYYYFKFKKRLYRFNFRKDKLIREGADPDKTEHEIMLEKGIYRIYDSGSLKFIWPS